jgi:hypothetical protein
MLPKSCAYLRLSALTSGEAGAMRDNQNLL